MGFWTWIQMIWSFIASSPLLRQILQGFVEDLKKQAQDLLPFIEEACSKALTQPGSGEEKFNLVLEAAKSAFPNIAGDVLRAAIQNVFTYVVAPTLVNKDAPAPTTNASGPTSG